MCDQSLGRNQQCQEPSIYTLFCPTWVGSENGPLFLCEKCSHVFRPEMNPNNDGTGSFHWGQDAYTAFDACKVIPRKTKPRQYENVKSMVRNAEHVFADGQFGGLFSKHVAIIDGIAWLLTYYNAVNLGEHSKAKTIFPKFFAA